MRSRVFVVWLVSSWMSVSTSVAHAAGDCSGCPAAEATGEGVGFVQPYPDYGQYAPPGAYLELNVTELVPGTRFYVCLDNTLDSSYSRAGEEFVATVAEPLRSGGTVVVPAGSKLIGQVTNVVCAKSFRFGANGKIDVRFVALRTPDGQIFPLTASVDTKELRRAGGVRGNRAGAVAASSGGGALKGAGWGAGIGAVVAIAGGGSLGGTLRGAGAGAVAGSALGAGAGLIAAGVRKGVEVRVPVGTRLTVFLDEPLRITSRAPAGAVSENAWPQAQPYAMQNCPAQPTATAHPASQPPQRFAARGAWPY